MKVTTVRPVEAFVVGSGIASRARTVCLIPDGAVSGEDIATFEESSTPDGSRESLEKGYVLPAGWAFLDKVQTGSRLVADSEIRNTEAMGLSVVDRIALFELLASTEALLGSRRIDEHFAKPFFKTHFWYMWCTLFAFHPWHSLSEFKRYCLRFIQESHRVNTLGGIPAPLLKQYESPVRQICQMADVSSVDLR